MDNAPLTQIDVRISAVGIVNETQAQYGVIIMHVWNGRITEDTTDEEILALGPPLVEGDVIFCCN